MFVCVLLFNKIVHNILGQSITYLRTDDVLFRSLSSDKCPALVPIAEKRMRDAADLRKGSRFIWERHLRYTLSEGKHNNNNNNINSTIMRRKEQGQQME